MLSSRKLSSFLPPASCGVDCIYIYIYIYECERKKEGTPPEINVVSTAGGSYPSLPPCTCAKADDPRGGRRYVQAGFRSKCFQLVIYSHY